MIDVRALQLAAGNLLLPVDESRECEAPSACAVTEAACLPCRARYAIDEHDRGEP